MMELTPLRYFLSAYETGTFSQAARLNAVSQPTVSAAIQKLEAHFGAPLFQRERSGLKATALGEQLYQDTAGSVAQLSAVEGRMRGQPVHTVRVYCFPDVLLGPFARTMQSVARQAGNLAFSFTAAPDDSDLSYAAEGCVPKGHGFVPVLTERYGVALGRTHPLARRAEVRLEDLMELSIIHRPYCPNADRFDLMAAARPMPSAQAVHDQQVLELVAAGLGIAFVPMSHGDAHSGIVVRQLRGQDVGQRTIGISHRKTVFATQLAERLTGTARP
ncbi:LysR family transcriptional regulator [Sulfitobacter pseudonitzschiae]|uniref:LysR family transcriptional regulator n=1 Tax=Pseudosulfitobacter pseudonitzschiae TaxID=1402135 RepID=A0A9Q2NVR9_9RHOB|nr:LysR family transcriptional regulator [Pseudosulfitobacter pseudonitzschiae]MBM2293492.1 LysR family transcriptional regulator [Pseudosulfitobacter pseudonitzschiae]MBM2298306.1 LysR family transcriptional regulator [Pseudosulfitobacter pseudonitzschiae]MBM2303219.1 LysR family transcriptional regulator [Pseudosulfitobacter pseudonitzschiae]MBM2313003.1 LysR family transcriptional regulator [Pseudosulfitobacter pseudonitzschiae]MBM2317916.1 LysR family transcriptional regulator [Pseudosulfi